MLYHIAFNVNYPDDMSWERFHGIWSEEATVALDAKKQGVLVDLWKVVGERKVIAIAEVEDSAELDAILRGLPIMRAIGQHIDVEVKALCRYEEFAGHLEHLN